MDCNIIFHDCSSNREGDVPLPLNDSPEYDTHHFPLASYWLKPHVISSTNQCSLTMSLEERRARIFDDP